MSITNKNKNLSLELFEEYFSKFDSFSDKEIVEAFNGQVGNQGSGTAKMSYLRAIKSQFEKRNFDFSEVGNNQKMSYRNKVHLKGKKLYKTDS